MQEAFKLRWICIGDICHIDNLTSLIVKLLTSRAQKIKIVGGYGSQDPGANKPKKSSIYYLANMLG